jgi:hypothetical protein
VPMGLSLGSGTANSCGRFAAVVVNIAGGGGGGGVGDGCLSDE